MKVFTGQKALQDPVGPNTFILAQSRQQGQLSDPILLQLTVSKLNPTGKLHKLEAMQTASHYINNTVDKSTSHKQKTCQGVHDAEAQSTYEHKKENFKSFVSEARAVLTDRQTNSAYTKEVEV